MEHIATTLENLEPMSKQDIADFLKCDINAVNHFLWRKKPKGIYKITKYQYLVNKLELLENLKLATSEKKNDR